MQKWIIILGLMLSVGTSMAFDVDPSKDTVGSTALPGKRFDIFAGDPKRVQRANAIKRDEFQIQPHLSSGEVILDPSTVTGLPTLRAGLGIVNKTKRTKTLAFPDSKRIEVVIRDAQGNEVYRWSNNKQFTPAIGQSMVNPGEKVVYAVDVPLDQWSVAPAPGKYQVEATLANYPEFIITTNLTVINKTQLPNHLSEEFIGPRVGQH